MKTVNELVAWLKEALPDVQVAAARTLTPAYAVTLSGGVGTKSVYVGKHQVLPWESTEFDRTSEVTYGCAAMRDIRIHFVLILQCPIADEWVLWKQVNDAMHDLGSGRYLGGVTASIEGGILTLHDSWEFLIGADNYV